MFTTFSQKMDSAVEILISDLTELIRRQALEIAEEALRGFRPSMGSTKATASRKPLPTGTSLQGDQQKRTSTFARRSREELSRLVLSAGDYICHHPGQSVGQIARALNVTPRSLVLPLRKLVENGTISMHGQRGAATYSAAGASAGSATAQANAA